MPTTQFLLPMSENLSRGLLLLGLLVSCCSCRQNLQQGGHYGYPTAGAEIYSAESGFEENLAHIHEYGNSYGCSDCQYGPGITLASSEAPYLDYPRKDEYLIDGGDRLGRARIDSNSEVSGLDQEDTVAHFQRTDNRLEVTVSNQVAIYAPRFAAARQVVDLYESKRSEGYGNLLIDSGTRFHQNKIASNNVGQRLQTEQANAEKGTNTFRVRNRGLNLERYLGPSELSEMLQPYANLAIMRTGKMEQQEGLLVEKRTAAAETWVDNQAVEIVLNEQMAQATILDEMTAGIQQYVIPPGKTRVQIVKMASTDNALEGDIVDFTIRFDNLGDQEVAAVTILDNLTPRLEYIPESTECSVEANFSTSENAGGSLKLQWILTEPLKPSEGGLIRFRCRVR
ncbi:MAG: DUF11 domain-containing protein [Pirellulaceae bacterium]|nr:DUF11 domain-containing protein [Pirellulaceae bacterium]